MSRRLKLSAEHGYTMAAVMLVMLATTILAGATFAAVGADIPFARESQDRKQAYAAAEAGIEYYLYQLTRDNDYWTNCDNVEDPGDGEPSPVNLANPGSSRTWRKVAGSEAKFSIELLPSNDATECDPDRSEETMLDESSGSFRIRSTGVSNGVRRSVVTTMRRTSFLDYLYFTDYEASDPNSFPTTSQQEYARTNCVKYRTQRNQDTWCRDNTNITFPDWDAIRGPLHTNDDLLTCGTPEFGRPGRDDVTEIHGPAPGGFVRGSGCSGSPTFHGPVRQPAEHLPVPTSNTRLRQAADANYVFAGKTEITFDGSQFMDVRRWSSNTASTTTRMPLPDNGVIYVDSNGACSIAAPREIAYNASGDWRCGLLVVRGIYPKSMTLGAAVDILVDNDLRHESNGSPVLGLIAQRFVRVYHPVTRNSDGDCTGNAAGIRTNITIDAAILALNDSFIVDNYNCGAPMGTLTVFGAIAQKFRGPVGTFSGATKASGYTKNYVYNDELRYRSPPYFLDPLQAAWRVVRANEQVPAAQ
jgi:hypothetical protein